MKADDRADHPPWYKTAVIYGIDVALFFDADGNGVGDLRGIIAKLDYLADLGITCIWLLPFYPSPDRDNGYDVANYIDVDPRVGNLRDFRNLVRLAEKRGIRILIDLVVHHTSDTHPWFYASCADRTSRYGDYYIWTEQHPGPCCQTPAFPVVCTDVWEYDESARAFYRHFFYPFQPDLNFANPAVREEVVKITEFWLTFGIAGFRLDALNHIFASKDLPGTGLDPAPYLEDLHGAIEIHRPGAVLLAEADVAPESYATYFGSGNRIQMLFNFLVDKAFFLAMARQQAKPLVDLFRLIPEHPLSGQLVPFLRNFDEFNLERLNETEQQEVFERFAPDPQMRVYGRGIRRRIAPMLDGDERQIKMAMSLVLSMPGTPLFMFGDEIGMGEDLSLPERDSVRTPMQWSGEKHGGFSRADDLYRHPVSAGSFGYQRVNVEAQSGDPASILHAVKRFIELRKEHPAFGCGRYRVLDTGCPSVLGLAFSWREDEVVAVHNLSGEPADAVLDAGVLERLIQVHADREYSPEPAADTGAGRGRIALGPYGYRWFCRADTAGDPGLCTATLTEDPCRPSPSG